MSRLFSADGQLLAPTKEKRLVVAMTSDGLSMVAQEDGGRWFHPVKLMPTGQPGAYVPIPLWSMFGGDDAESMPAVPDKMLMVSYNLSDQVRQLYASFLSQIKSGLVLARGMPA